MDLHIKEIQRVGKYGCQYYILTSEEWNADHEGFIGFQVTNEWGDGYTWVSNVLVRAIFDGRMYIHRADEKDLEIVKEQLKKHKPIIKAINTILRSQYPDPLEEYEEPEEIILR